LFADDRRPPDALWRVPLVSSRLLEHELWTRVNAHGAADTHGDAVREVLARVSLVELAPTVLARALEPFPAPARTLTTMTSPSVETSGGVSVLARASASRRLPPVAGPAPSRDDGRRPAGGSSRMGR
jgi:hypothetical protein